MCRLVSWASERPRSFAEVLGRQGADRFGELSSVHSHGWGVAWIDEPGAPVQVRRSTLEASKDPDFHAFADSVKAVSAVVHVRMATPGMGYTIEDSHPFQDGSSTLAHNGAILPPERIGELLRPDSLRRARGRTDSERYFLALLDAMEDDGNTLADAVQAVLDRMAEVGLNALSLNAMLLEPSALHVVSCHHPVQQPVGFQLWPKQQDPPPPYFDVWAKVGPGLVVAASSGIIKHTPEWQLLDPACVMSVDAATLDVSTSRIRGVERLHGLRPSLS
jgi:predicted glutamine amidotransferase